MSAKPKRVTGLRAKQAHFACEISRLILWAEENGYEVTLGDAYRDPRVFGMVGEWKGYGASKSQHKRRLAMDLNLFIDGEYCYATEDHIPLGEQWEKMGHVWGGRFNDGNHYQYE